MPSERLRAHDQDLELADNVMETDREAGPPAAADRAGRIESDAQLAGVVQRRAQGADSGGELGSDVADRIQSERSNGASLPETTRTEMEQRFGADFSEVRIHTDAESTRLNAQLGATAMTSGRDIFLSGGEQVNDQELIAHELTHVVQQGAHEEKPTTVGASDSSAEQAAEGTGAEVQVTPGEVQRYTDSKKIQGQYARVSEGGNVIVLGQSNYSQDLYATDSLITSANARLKAAGEKGSYIRLVKSGETIEHGGKALHRIAPVFKGQGDGKNAKLGEENKGKDADDKLSLWADCGRSSRAVMGSHGDQAPHAVYDKGGKETDTSASYRPADYSDTIYMATMPAFLANPAHAEFLKSGVHHRGDDRTAIIAPTDADQARAQYWELGEKGRRVFDKFAGINTAADPSVGGGYTMNTEYNMPGFKEQGDMTWNFHWAGVVMEDGTDNITLENYAAGDYDTINTEWNFQMYGTVKKGQTFHEQHLASGTHANRASTFEVEPEGS